MIGGGRAGGAQLRTLEEIAADILAIEKEGDGLLDGLLKVGAR